MNRTGARSGVSRNRRWKYARIALTWAYLMVGWILFTWSFRPLFLAAGAILACAIALITYGSFVAHNEAERRSLLPRVHLILVYAFFLVLNIYVASVRVAVSIVTGRIEPGIVHFRTRLKSDVARVMLANSITITPGTVTLELDDDHVIVHWLDVKTTHSKYAGRLIKGKLEGWLGRIWI